MISRYTFNAGAQYDHAITDGGLGLLARLDYRRIGKTWWEPYNTTVRKPVDLVNARLGLPKHLGDHRLRRQSVQRDL